MDLPGCVGPRLSAQRGGVNGLIGAALDVCDAAAPGVGEHAAKLLKHIFTAVQRLRSGIVVKPGCAVGAALQLVIEGSGIALSGGNRRGLRLHNDVQRLTFRQSNIPEELQGQRSVVRHDRVSPGIQFRQSAAALEGAPAVVTRKSAPAQAAGIDPREGCPANIVQRASGRICDVPDLGTIRDDTAIHLDDPVQRAVGPVSGGHLGCLIIPAELFCAEMIAALHGDRGADGDAGEDILAVADPHFTLQRKLVAHHDLGDALRRHGLGVIGQEIGIISIHTHLCGCELKGPQSIHLDPGRLVRSACAQIRNDAFIRQVGGRCVVRDRIGIYLDIAHKLHVLAAQSILQGCRGHIPVAGLIGHYPVLVAACGNGETAGIRVRSDGSSGGIVNAAGHGHGHCRLLLLTGQLAVPDLAAQRIGGVIGIQHLAASRCGVIGINTGAVIDPGGCVARRGKHTGLDIDGIGQRFALAGCQRADVVGKAVVVLHVAIGIREYRPGSLIDLRQAAAPVLILHAARIQMERSLIVGQVLADPRIGGS